MKAHTISKFLKAMGAVRKYRFGRLEHCPTLRNRLGFQIWGFCDSLNGRC